MRQRYRANQGFTLVEILIVVVILGILAAVVIPQFTSASESARAASLANQLQTARSQIELYQVQHNGNYPNGGSGAIEWSKMTQKTDISGDTGASTTPYGPYFQEAPANPLAPSDVDDTSVSTGNGSAWKWSDNQLYAVIAPEYTEQADAAGLVSSGDASNGSHDYETSGP